MTEEASLEFRLRKMMKQEIIFLDDKNITI